MRPWECANVFSVGAIIEAKSSQVFPGRDRQLKAAQGNCAIGGDYAKPQAPPRGSTPPPCRCRRPSPTTSWPKIAGGRIIWRDSRAAKLCMSVHRLEPSRTRSKTEKEKKKEEKSRPGDLGGTSIFPARNSSLPYSTAAIIFGRQPAEREPKYRRGFPSPMVFRSFGRLVSHVW